MKLQSGLKRGPGTWKFNNTLFEDQDYIDLINFIYPRTLEIYKDVESKQLLSLGIDKDGTSSQDHKLF